MKKIYFKIVLTGLLLFVMVACGLKFTEITFSSHAIYPGDNLTIDMTLVHADDDPQQYANYNNLYVYFGVRVPEGWTTAEMLTAVDIENGHEPVAIEFENSDFYAALLELCYPKDGLKWLAYQSVKRYNVHGQPSTAHLVLKSSEATGTYKLDFACGSSQSDPTDLYSDGQINYAEAFKNKQTKKVGEIDCALFQEYLLNATTFTEEEIQDRADKLIDVATVPVLNSDPEKLCPISPVDVANYFSKDNTIDLSVNVATTNTGVDEVYESSLIDVKAVKGGIEVTSNGGIATVYDLAGRILATEFVNDKATIDVRPGACIVRVIEGNRSAVSKVIVK